MKRASGVSVEDPPVIELVERRSFVEGKSATFKKKMLPTYNQNDWKLSKITLESSLQWLTNGANQEQDKIEFSKEKKNTKPSCASLVTRRKDG